MSVSRSKFLRVLVGICLIIAPLSMSCGQPGQATSLLTATRDTSPVQRIADKIKSALSDWDAITAHELMKKQLIQLRLMTNEGKWKHKILEEHASTLLPNNFDKTKLHIFLDEIAINVAANPYMMEFLNQAEGENFENLVAKFEEEGAEVLPDVLAYAIVLQLLTEAMVNDWRMIEACQKVWKEARNQASIIEHLGWFEVAKLTTVDLPISMIIKFHKHNIVSRIFGRGILWANIMEAVTKDWQFGNLDNAKTGRILASNKTGALFTDEETGAGPTRFSDDRKLILFKMPLTHQWTDLYSTWNMAFVSQYPNWPFVIAKLLIPQVSGYQNNPEGYMYNRIIALHAHLHYSFINRADLAKAGKTSIQWQDEELTRVWGEVNLESANKYKEALQKTSN